MMMQVEMKKPITPIIPESHEQDIGAHHNPSEHQSQSQDEIDTMPEEEEPQMEENKTQQTKTL